jgi:MFS family permease
VSEKAVNEDLHIVVNRTNRPTERATAMGWYYSGVSSNGTLPYQLHTRAERSETLLGPSLAPVIGGLFAQYITHGWRACQ